MDQLLLHCKVATFLRQMMLNLYGLWVMTKRMVRNIMENDPGLLGVVLVKGEY